ncbi:hypothetical protein GCK72_005486 [Caenorhabditis remanei]|uniref:Uncharacterized protein n=1 Tax=Caenorhabditis remanei TaxID=31234 RepID=A0A6A5HFK8_CAERE|nr:hypothetical protein GCK72_005486 [Caenorhabditis remanei]KAF1765534.1 hypothetical protein GCK72_005486 [Caenorhabditis remanei]
MIIRPLFFLIVSIFATTSAQQQPQQCGLESPEIKSMKPSFGGISGFYNIAKGISDGLQNTPNSKTYNDLNNLIFGSGAVTYDQVITDMVVNQIGAIIFWSVGFVFVLAALVLGIATCIWQCCYSCVPKETSTRSEITGYVYAVLLFSAFSFILTGLVLFNVAETNLIDSVDNGMVYTNQISGDLNNVIQNGTDQITCEVTATTSQTFTNMNSLIQNYSSNVVDGTKDQVGITEVNNFNQTAFANANTATTNAANELKTSLQNVKSNDETCNKNMETLNGQFTPVVTTLTGLTAASQEVTKSDDLTKLLEQISAIQTEVQLQANQASGAINGTQDQINQSMSSITEMLTNVQQDINSVINSLKSAHRDLVTSSAYTAVKIGIRLAVTIPACIGCCFCILAFVVVIMSLREPDGMAMKLSVAVLSAFYSTIIISIILLLFSSLAFVLGWFTSAMCVPIFEDPNYQLFHLMNQTIAPVQPNGSPDVINIGDVLHSCNDHSMTLYTAIDGQIVISANSISQQLNLDTYRIAADKQIMQQPNVSFTLNPAWQVPKLINELDTNTQNAKAAVLDSCGDNDASAKYKTYVDNLMFSNTLSAQFYGNLQNLSTNSPNTTLIATQQNDNYFQQGDLSINQSISMLMENLEKNVFKCRPLVDIYNNGGFVMCEQFGKPIQGMWAGIGLAGIFLFFLSILLLLTYRWLKTNSEKGSGADYIYGQHSNGTRKLGEHNKIQTSDEYDIFTKPVISSTSNTGRRLPRVRPYDMDVVQPTEYDYEQTAAQMQRVQVLPDERHPNMSPSYFDTQNYGTRNTRFNDVDLFDNQSNNSSTQRGLRRM